MTFRLDTSIPVLERTPAVLAALLDGLDDRWVRGDLLEEFARLRAANLEQLRSWSLGEAELDLTGEHPELGRVTLRHLLATWVVHDLGHLAQVARVMAKQRRDDVGPWAPFVPVLSDRT